ncbi:signal transduction histidine kinase [Streptacidiphilus sp. MAP12-16]|uniref:sensor histidine kinase n=1 Tax=Streptacidiphilus sp. MAP12-16 TaxID=3156300 RepID=UPI003516FFAF
MATSGPDAGPTDRAPVWRTALRVGYAPFTRRAWHETAFVAAGVPMALPTAGALAVVLPGKLSGTVMLTILLVVVLCHRLLTRLQRDRFQSMLGLEIPAAPEREGPWISWQTVRWFRSETTWRQLGYHLIASPLLATGAVLVLCGWTVGFLLSTIFAWAWAAPPDSVAFSGQNETDLWLSALGVVLVLTMPWAARLLVRLDTRAAAALLGPNRARELERRVESLAESRSEVVDAADAERRRIERDLHDGAQQRLVSMAMNLGLARRMLRGLPPEQQAVRAMKVIDEAHLEAQAAIAELRDLVRGLHPVVLEDRGLDAALSGIVARAPLPVRLSVNLPERAAPPVEAVAYFVVSEALANIAKHARASRAEVTVRQSDGRPGAQAGSSRLVIAVTDDGVGGADPAKGTGLSGLRQRAASVDGTLTIDSPLGGPTTLTVELPCAL